MSDVIQTITLCSEQNFADKIPPKAFGELLTVLPDAIRFSVRMAFEFRSQAAGKRPRWLTAASDVRFLRHEGSDNTKLYFAAPELGTAAKEIYKQKELWQTRPDPNDTGLDLLADAIGDVAANNVDSDKFDHQLLRQIERFKHGLNGTFQSLQYTRRGNQASTPTVINSTVIENASILSQSTPTPQLVRVVGKLDMIRSSTNAFAVKLKDGEEARGVFTAGKVSQLSELMEQEVLILGKAVYRPSGKLLRIDAESVTRADQNDEFFSTIPRPRLSKFDLREVVRTQQNKKGLTAIFGKWPGDESETAIDCALKEIE